MNKVCAKCPHNDNCRTFWGRSCREAGGKRIPKFIIESKAQQEPEEWVGRVIWANGAQEFFTAEDLERGKKRHAKIG